MEYGKTKPMGEMMKLLHFWEAQNANKHGDLMGVYITLVDEKVYREDPFC
ncbi:unnamed protein product [Brassica rapa subsp. trilocularis]